MQHIPQSNINSKANRSYDLLDDSLKRTLADQIHHLGGIENSDWCILTATFDSFYRETDNSTRSKLYYKLAYWRRYPARFNRYICLANSPALKSSRQAILPSTPVHRSSTPTPQSTPNSLVPTMSDYYKSPPDTPNASPYTQYLPTGYDASRIGTFFNHSLNMLPYLVANTASFGRFVHRILSPEH